MLQFAPMSQALATAAAKLGGKAGLARVLSVTPGAVHQMVSGARPTPPDRCPSIERAVRGEITVQQLRPDVRWVRVPDPDWPHPEGRPCIDVAAPPVPAEQQQEVRDAA